MRILRSIVQSLMLLMLYPWHDLNFRRAVAPQLVGNDHPRHVPQALQQLAEEPLGGLFVPAALHQDVQDVAILIHGTPQIMILAVDLNEHLIEVPLISGPGTSSAQSISVCLAELEAPFSDGLIRESDAAYGQYLFNVTVAESETKI